MGHKLTGDTYTRKTDEMKRTLETDSETSGPSWMCPWTSHLPLGDQGPHL